MTTRICFTSLVTSLEEAYIHQIEEVQQKTTKIVPEMRKLSYRERIVAVSFLMLEERRKREIKF